MAHSDHPFSHPMFMSDDAQSGARPPSVNVSNVPLLGPEPGYPTVVDQLESCCAECSSRSRPDMRIKQEAVPEIDTGGER